MLTKERLCYLLEYDLDYGQFTWKVSRQGTKGVGSIAGCKNPRSNYWQIKVDGVKYLAHRLVWLWGYGESPACDIDHINGERSDNKLSNLRLAPNGAKDNQQNLQMYVTNSTGYVGVRRSNSKKNPWRAQIMVEGSQISLGYFSNIEAAQRARELGKAKYHPFQSIQRV